MGFRCVFCGKDFGTNRDVMNQHINELHKGEELSKNVFNLNFEDILSKATFNEIDFIRSKYDKKTTYDESREVAAQLHPLQ